MGVCDRGTAPALFWFHHPSGCGASSGFTALGRGASSTAARHASPEPSTSAYSKRGNRSPPSNGILDTRRSANRAGAAASSGEAAGLSKGFGVGSGSSLPAQAAVPPDWRHGR